MFYNLFNWKIIELTGYTRRVYEMFRLFQLVNKSEKPSRIEEMAAIDSNNNNQRDQSEAFSRMNLQTASTGKIKQKIPLLVKFRQFDILLTTLNKNLQISFFQ